MKGFLESRREVQENFRLIQKDFQRHFREFQLCSGDLGEGEFNGIAGVLGRFAERSGTFQEKFQVRLWSSQSPSEVPFKRHQILSRVS